MRIYRCRGGKNDKFDKEEGVLDDLAEEIAEARGMFLLLKVGKTGYYATYDGRNFSVEHNWAHL